jgi:hypothetical protein
MVSGPRARPVPDEPNAFITTSSPRGQPAHHAHGSPSVDPVAKRSVGQTLGLLQGHGGGSV